MLLLNSVLTVDAHHANSHQGQGWEAFTDAVVSMLSDSSRPLVFMLWGGYARKKATRVDRSRHLVLECDHPSPLAGNGFVNNCDHFVRANEFLVAHSVAPVDWWLIE